MVTGASIDLTEEEKLGSDERSLSESIPIFPKDDPSVEPAPSVKLALLPMPPVAVQLSSCQIRRDGGEGNY